MVKCHLLNQSTHIRGGTVSPYTPGVSQVNCTNHLIVIRELTVSLNCGLHSHLGRKSVEVVIWTHITSGSLRHCENCSPGHYMCTVLQLLYNTGHGGLCSIILTARRTKTASSRKIHAWTIDSASYRMLCRLSVTVGVGSQLLSLACKDCQNSLIQTQVIEKSWT